MSCSLSIWLLSFFVLTITTSDALLQKTTTKIATTSFCSPRRPSPCSPGILFRQSPTLLHLSPQQLGSFEPLTVAEPRKVNVAFYGLFDDDNNNDTTTAQPIAFQDAWTIQQNLQSAQFQQLIPGQRTEDYVYDKDSSLDTLLFVQHQPVYTLGTASDRRFILGEGDSTSSSATANTNTSTSSNIPIVDINRGGEVTYHGPGQLVVYPILNLRNYRTDLHWYMRSLEEAVLYALELAGIDTAERSEDTTGVWVDNHKVAAIGVSARRWITQHGVAINVEETCMSAFDGIVPCGLEGRKVGYLNQFVDQPLTVQTFIPYMMEAMEYVFRMELELSESSC